MSSQPVPPTVAGYLSALEGPRADLARELFDTVHAAIPDGYELTDFRGAPLWVAPAEPEPVQYAAIIAQKNYVSLYLMGVYTDSAEEQSLRKGWADAGLKLDMGKSCVRLRSRENTSFETVRRAVAAFTPERFLTVYEHSRRA